MSRKRASNKASTKNKYRIVLDAVLRLPWLEGLAFCRFIDDDGLCCAVGAVSFGDTPRLSRAFSIREIRNYRKKFGNRLEGEVTLANDMDLFESPLDRKHRMIKWLRKKADAVDNKSSLRG